MENVKRLRIVRPTGYPALFNTPRNSRHDIKDRYWLPLHKINRRLEAPLILIGLRPTPVATFNRIPLGIRPFVITFESHLPRLFDYPNGVVNDFFVNQLLSSRCRAIIPFSDFAHRTFLHQHRDSSRLECLEKKLLPVIYPALPVPDRVPFKKPYGGKFRIVFVGSHFIRKGGLALLRAAEMAFQAGLPIEFHIISKLTMGRGAGVWTDPIDMASLDDELRSLSLPNVIRHGQLNNKEVITLLKSADLKVLPTISDTFGYSALEAFAHAIPVIGTDTCSLPEIIDNGSNGILINADTNELGEWKHLFSYQNDSEEVYIDRLKNAERSKGNDLFNAIESLRNDPVKLEEMSDAAYQTALKKFSSAVRDLELDDLYEKLFG
jgi:glycosyltransferase involved in cell wall biosynthesis